MPKERGRYKDGEKAIQELHERINKLTDSIKQYRVGTTPPGEGGSAEQRVVDGGDGYFYIEVKTPNGWMRTGALEDASKK